MFYSVDVETGNRTPIRTLSSDINAIGYSALDNNIYAVRSNVSPYKVLKIGAQGQEAVILNLPAVTGVTSWNVGDVDDNGQFWIASAGRQWLQIDISNLRVVASGTATITNAVYDWAFVPGGGNFLYAVNSDASGNAFLFRFDRTAKTWTQVSTGYGQLYPARATIGAAYAGRAGELYVSDNTSGRIHRVSLDGRTAQLIQTGPTATANDGAHCILNGT